MPTEQLTEQRGVETDRASPPRAPGEAPASGERALRELAVQHLEQVRKFKRYLVAYVLSLLVLTPVWAITQYLDQDGWPKHLSSRSRYPGDWDPWIIWVALVGAVIVAIAGYRAYFGRPSTEDEIEREIARITSRR